MNLKKKLYEEIIDTVDIRTVSTRKINKAINVIVIYDNYDLFEEYYMSFCHEANSTPRLFVSIDCEFDVKHNALMQLQFESKHECYIFIVNPAKLKSTFTKNILENKNIVKILHGSDSLDISYINKTLCKNKDSFTKFINTVYDTRFACEYVKTYINHIEDKKIDIKCSLYTALLEFNVIDKKQYDILTKICGSIDYARMNWSIKDLKSEQIKYAYFDVVYLRHLYSNIIKVSKKHNQVYLGLKYIPSFFRLLCLNREGYDNSLTEIKITYDTMNSYIIKDISKTMNEYFNEQIQDMKLFNNIQPYSYLYINFFKKMCVTLFKSVIYNKVLQEHDVYVDKHTQLTKKYDINDVYDKIKSEKLTRLLKMIFTAVP